MQDTAAHVSSCLWGCRLAQELLRRTEPRVQPFLQKFLTNVLLGMRTDSELRDDCHALIFQVGAGAAGKCVVCLVSVLDKAAEKWGSRRTEPKGKVLRDRKMECWQST